MASLEEYVAVIFAIAVYAEQVVDFCLAPTAVAPVSTALIVVLANASLGGNVTRIASVQPPPPIDHYQNWSESKTGMVQPVPKPESQPELKEFLCCKYTVRMFGPVYEQLIEAQRLRKIPNFRPWPSEFSLQV